MSTEQKEPKDLLTQFREEKEQQLQNATQALRQMEAQHKNLGDQIMATRGMIEETNRSLHRIKQLQDGTTQEKPAETPQGPDGPGGAAQRGPRKAE